MATHDYIISNASGASVRADLNNALAAIVSNNSNATSPATTYAYQWWADTTTGQLKLRNSANSAWITIFELDGTMLMEDGTVSAPGLAFASDLNTGFFRSAADKINFATGGAERLEIGSSEVVFNDPSNDVDFRVESNGQTHMLFVDAGNDRVGIGTSAPGDTFEVKAGFPVIAMLDSDTTNDKFRIVHNGGSTQLQVDPNNVSSSSHLLVSVDGSEAARIDSSGRLLVGTSSARTNYENSNTYGPILNLEGTSNSNRVLSFIHNDNSGGPFLALGSTGGSAAGSNTLVAAQSTLGFLSFQGADGTDLVAAARIKAQVDGTPGANDMPGRLVFETTADGASSPTERLRIDSSGNLGINTTSPFALLHVKAATNKNLIVQNGGTDTIEVSNYNTGDGYREVAIGGSVVKFQTGTAGGGSSSERARLDSSGRLLVGTTTEGYSVADNLTIADSGNCGVTIRSGSSSTGSIYFSDATSGGGEYDGYIEYSQNSRFMRFGTAQVERVRITDGGDLLVNRTSRRSNEKFSVDNAANVAYFGCTTNSNVSSIQMVHAYAQGSQSATQIQFQNNTATTVGSIQSTGSATSFNTSSDYRLKENVVDLDGAIARVKQLAPKRFNFIADDTTTVDGFLAHEAQTVVPEAVTGTHNQVQVWDESEELPEGVSAGDNKLDEDGNTIPEYQGIDQSKLVPLLTAALKEAIAKIETLETKVAALEAG